jgi:hypothetical protein
VTSAERAPLFGITALGGGRISAVITPTALERWGYTMTFGSVALLMLFAAVVNAFAGTARDAVGLLLGAVFMLTLPALRWVRFVFVAESGVTFRNWAVVRFVPWDDIDGFKVRRLLQPRGRGWVVVACRRTRRGVTLRATGRPGSYRADRDHAAAAEVAELAAELEDARSRAAARTSTHGQGSGMSVSSRTRRGSMKRREEGHSL